VNASRRDCTLEPRTGNEGDVGRPLPGWHADPSVHAVRTGLRYVQGLNSELLDRIDAERSVHPFADLDDFARRTYAPVDALETLAMAGAFRACFGVDRRAGLWGAGALRDARADKLPGVAIGVEAPPLPGMSEVEETAADLWATGMSPGRHPTEFLRAGLTAAGVLTAADLRTHEPRRVVEVAGVVTHRQQPQTAKGTIFLNLEDETGLVNVICSAGVWKRFRKVARVAPALRIRGILERHQGVTNLVAQRITPLPIGLADVMKSRDFR
jgi:error-prone DNA polymerase